MVGSGGKKLQILLSYFLALFSSYAKQGRFYGTILLCWKVSKENELIMGLIDIIIATGCRHQITGVSLS